MNSADAGTPTGFFSPLVRIGIDSGKSIDRHERRYLLFALAVFALFAAYHACTLPLWFDEFFTLFISRLSSLPEMLRAMPADGQPPLQYLLTHVSIRLLGETEFALRLPDLLAYIAGGLLTYRIVRRHGTASQALFAMALLLGAFVGIQQGFTARPYELLIAFTALAFACWQAAALSQHDRILPLCGVALGVAGAVLSHHFGVIHALLPLAVGETSRLIQRRRLDGWMIVAVSVGLSPLALTLPMARQSHLVLGEAILHSTNFYAKPSLNDLLSYFLMVALPLLSLVAVFAFLPWPDRTAESSSGDLPPIPAHEWAAVGALSLLLPAMISLAALETGYFVHKYAISTSLGLALLAGWALPRLRFGRLRIIPQPVLALSTLCFLLLVATLLLLTEIFQPIGRVQPGSKTLSRLLDDAPGELPIVVARASDYPPEWWYSPSSLKPRLIYLSDIPYALHQPDFLGDLSLTQDQAYIPLRTSDYSSFIASHPHFLVLCTGESRFYWVPTRLQSAGWRLTPIARNGPDVLYRVDRP